MLRNVSSGGRRPTAVHTHRATSPAPQSRQWSVASLDRVTGLRHAGHCHVSRVTLCPCVIVMVRWCHLSSLVITFSDHRILGTSASKSSIRRFVITEKAPTRAFSRLKAPTSAFTFKTLLRHYAKRALTPRSLNVKLGPRRNYHKGRAAIRHYANQTARPL